MATTVVATEAALHTLSVTITSLTVSGKQMTLAVFRQLPTCEALKDGVLLQGVAYWGIVRYTIKDQGDLWLVIEKGGQLYRSNAAWTLSTDGERRGRESALQIKLHIKTLDQIADEIGTKQPPWSTSYENAVAWRDRWGAQSRVASQVFGTYACDGPSVAKAYVDNREKALLHAQGFEYAAEWSKRAMEAWNSLSGLPQLFIAV